MAGREAPRAYLDTSAYLCDLLGEEGHDDILSELAGSCVVSSTLLVLESTRNLVRLARAGHLSPDDLERCLERVRADEEIFAL